MAPKLIVSYDGTENDQDALALARRFADAGAEVHLAYVRHGARAEERSPEDMLRRGAEWLGRPDTPQHIVMSASTAVGLAELVERENADLIVFGSAYRTAPGHVEPQATTSTLLEVGAPAAVAIAPAGLRDSAEGIATIAISTEAHDEGAEQTAHSLAERLGATVVSSSGAHADLIVLSSRADAPRGRTTVSSQTEYAIEIARSPVLVVRRGTPIQFGVERSLTA